MGRKTYETEFTGMGTGGVTGIMDDKHQEMIKIVLSRTLELREDKENDSKEVYICRNWAEVESALSQPDVLRQCSECWNIGGPGVYGEHLNRASPGTRIFITRIRHVYPQCDVLYPDTKSLETESETWKKLDDSGDPNHPVNVTLAERGIEYCYETWEKV